MSSTTTVHARRTSSSATWLALIGWVILAQAAGLVGLPFTDTGPGSWYDQLDKPAFTPPGWLFGPTWTLLYALIGIAAWRVWRLEDSPERTLGLRLWVVQLALNALWTPLFFGAELPWVAAIDIVALVLAIAATIAAFVRVDRPAAWLMVPYLCWVSFATVLTITIATAN
jgi:benzodiazapine receptor